MTRDYEDTDQDRSAHAATFKDQPFAVYVIKNALDALLCGGFSPADALAVAEAGISMFIRDQRGSSAAPYSTVEVRLNGVNGVHVMRRMETSHHWGPLDDAKPDDDEQRLDAETETWQRDDWPHAKRERVAPA